VEQVARQRGGEGLPLGFQQQARTTVQLLEHRWRDVEHKSRDVIGGNELPVFKKGRMGRDGAAGR
jgi:hypothetical protein